MPLPLILNTSSFYYINDLVNPQYWYSAKVSNVVDGDTVDLELNLGFRIYWNVRVRLYGINAYEMNSQNSSERDLAVKGKQYMIDKVLNKQVIINSHMDKADKYGRWLATIYYDGENNLNEQMIKEGLAVSYMV